MLKKYLFSSVVVSGYHAASRKGLDAMGNGHHSESDDEFSLSKQNLPSKLQFLFDVQFLAKLLADTESASEQSAQRTYVKQVEEVVFSDPVDRILYEKPLVESVAEFVPY